MDDPSKIEPEPNRLEAESSEVLARLAGQVGELHLQLAIRDTVIEQASRQIASLREALDKLAKEKK